MLASGKCWHVFHIDRGVVNYESAFAQQDFISISGLQEILSRNKLNVVLHVNSFTCKFHFNWSHDSHMIVT